MQKVYSHHISKSRKKFDWREVFILVSDGVLLILKFFLAHVVQILFYALVTDVCLQLQALERLCLKQWKNRCLLENLESLLYFIISSKDLHQNFIQELVGYCSYWQKILCSILVISSMEASFFLRLVLLLTSTVPFPSCCFAFFVPVVCLANCSSTLILLSYKSGTSWFILSVFRRNICFRTRNNILSNNYSFFTLFIYLENQCACLFPSALSCLG